MDWNTLIIGAIVGAIVTLPIAIFSNLISPWIKTGYDKSIFSSKQRRIDALIQEHKRIRAFREDKVLLVLAAIRGLAYGIVPAVVGLAGVSALVGFLILEGDKALAANLLPLEISIPAPRVSDAFVFWLGIFAMGLNLAESIYLFVATVINPINKTFMFYSYTDKVNKKIRKLGGTWKEYDDMLQRETEKQAQEMADEIIAREKTPAKGANKKPPKKGA